MADWENPTDSGNAPNITAAVSSVHYPTGTTYASSNAGATGYYCTWTWQSQGPGDVAPTSAYVYASYEIGDLSLALSAPTGSAFGDLDCSVKVNGTNYTAGAISDSVSNGARTTPITHGPGDTGSVQAYVMNDTVNIHVDASAGTDAEIFDADPNPTASAATSSAVVYVSGTHVIP